MSAESLLDENINKHFTAIHDIVTKYSAIAEKYK